MGRKEGRAGSKRKKRLSRYLGDALDSQPKEVIGTRYDFESRAGNASHDFGEGFGGGEVIALGGDYH